MGRATREDSLPCVGEVVRGVGPEVTADWVLEDRTFSRASPRAQAREEELISKLMAEVERVGHPEVQETGMQGCWRCLS